MEMRCSFLMNSLRRRKRNAHHLSPKRIAAANVLRSLDEIAPAETAIRTFGNGAFMHRGIYRADLAHDHEGPRDEIIADRFRRRQFPLSDELTLGGGMESCCWMYQVFDEQTRLVAEMSNNIQDQWVSASACFQKPLRDRQALVAHEGGHGIERKTIFRAGGGTDRGVLCGAVLSLAGLG